MAIIAKNQITIVDLNDGMDAVSIVVSPENVLLNTPDVPSSVIVDVYVGSQKLKYGVGDNGFMCSTLASGSYITEGVVWWFNVGGDNRFRYYFKMKELRDLSLDVPFKVTVKGVEYNRMIHIETVRGAAAEFHRLQPVTERAVVGNDALLSVMLSYEVQHVVGDSVTVVNPVDAGLSLRCAPQGSSTFPPLSFTQGVQPSLSYTLANYHRVPHPVRFVVDLLRDAEICERRIVDVIYDTAASLDVNDKLGEVTLTVQGADGNGGLVNSVAEIRATAGSISLKVDSLRPGGGNLLVNGDFLQGTKGFVHDRNPQSWGVVDISDLPGFTKALRAYCNAGNGVYAKKETGQEILYPMPAGEYLLSFYMKSSNQVGVSCGIEGVASKSFTVGTTWQRYWLYAKVESGDNHALTFYSSSTATLYLTGVMVERGNMLSEYNNFLDGELATGIDIKRKKVTVTSDNFEVRNNENQITMLLDADGKLNVSLINALKILTKAIETGEAKIGGFDIKENEITCLDWRSPARIFFANTDTGQSVELGNNLSSDVNLQTVFRVLSLAKKPKKDEFEPSRTQSVGAALAATGAQNNDASYIPYGCIRGFRHHIHRVSSSYTANKMDSVIVVTASGQSVLLPDTPEDGQVYKVIDKTGGGITVFSRTSNIIVQSSSNYTAVSAFNTQGTRKKFVELIYDAENKVWYTDCVM